VPATVTFIRQSDELPRLALFFARLEAEKIYFVSEKSGKRLRAKI
jgi:hypothetical protein